MYFNHFQEISNREIKLPYDLMAHLNLYNNSSLNISLLNSSRDRKYCELLVSQIGKNNREFLWMLSLSFFDRKGLISELTQFLKELNIDIKNCRAELSENYKFLNVKMVIDAQGFMAKVNNLPKPTGPKSSFAINILKTQISAVFSSNIIFHPAIKGPILEINQNYALVRSIKKFNKHEPVRVNKSKILIPNVLYEDMITKLSKYKSISERSRNEHEVRDVLPYCSMVSNLEHMHFRIYFFYPNTGIIHIRVMGDSSIGALSALTRIIRDKKFNVLQMFSRDQENGESINDFVLDIKEQDSRNASDKYLHFFIKSEIEQSIESNDYNWKVCIPRLLEKKEFSFYG